MKQPKEVRIIGHKNPDTDAICSAIAYAYFKNELAKRSGEDIAYIPMRAGQLNLETTYVLDTFGQNVPDYINDVRSQVRDALPDNCRTVSPDLSLKRAWKILNESRSATLPVVDSDRHLLGLITLGDIAKSFMGVYGNTILSEAKTPYKNIVDTLEGTLEVGETGGCIEQGKVLVATSSPDVMESYIEPGDLVILGDRYESQLCAIEMDAACLIICNDSEIAPSIRTLAEEHGCTVIRTGYNSYITARLLNQSIPIAHFMVRENLITFRAGQLIEDIRTIMSQKRHRDFPVLDEDGLFMGLISRHDLIDMRKKQLILVDHNEKNQAVDGIDDAQILEIIDHHKLGHVETLNPVTFRNMPAGCTATIVSMIFGENHIPIPPQIAGLMCSAIVSDTLLFRSPTCTPLDEKTATTLAGIAGVDLQEHAMNMFKAGSSLKSKSDEEIFYQDFKRFNAGKTSFGVGQITSIDQTELEDVRARMADYLKLASTHHEVEMIFFMLTNILDETTLLLCYGSGAVMKAENAFGIRAEEDALILPGVVSRKKQLIPKLMDAIQEN